MAQAYTPGLKVTPRTTHRCRRVLPIPGDVLVTQGQKVGVRDVVAQTFMPGDIYPVNLANQLSLPPAEVRESMLKKEGERIKVGEPLARTKGIFGLFKNEYKSQHEGTIENISDVTGQLIIRGEPVPVQVLAYMAGTVVEVIPREGCIVEASVAYVQGIFGIGGETFGSIRLACHDHTQELTGDLIKPEMKGCVIVGGARMTADAVARARDIGAAAVISGGIDDEDLKNFLGYDLGVAITGNEKVGLTVIVTEGFGEISMAERTFRLLRGLEGREASANGATQIRAGVMRPELIVTDPPAIPLDDLAKRYEAGQLEIGRPVRIIRDPYFGLIGRVKALTPEPAVLGSGSKARVLDVSLDSGEIVSIPRANVELIEG
jgi:hypothetical protein